jgi:hypothetical protein
MLWYCYRLVLFREWCAYQVIEDIYQSSLWTLAITLTRLRKFK